MRQPSLSQHDFDKYLPNRLTNGDHKITLKQWNHIKDVAQLLMDKETPLSPRGGITKDEIDELGGYLHKNEEMKFSAEQIEKVKSLMHEHVK